MMPVSILEEVPLFSGLAPSLLEPLAEIGRLEEFDGWRYIFKEGDAANALHVIRFGRVGLQLEVPGRGAVTLQTLKQGEVLGLSWLQPENRWLFDAKTLEVTRTLVFDAPELLNAMEKNHELGFRLMQRLTVAVGSRLQSTRLQLLDIYGIHR